MVEEIKDNITVEIVKRGRGRPKKEPEDKKILTSADRKDYMHNYYKSHYNPKPRIVNPDIKYGRPLKENRLTDNMKEYQRLYRQKLKMKRNLNLLD